MMPNATPNAKMSRGYHWTSGTCPGIRRSQLVIYASWVRVTQAYRHLYATQRIVEAGKRPSFEVTVSSYARSRGLELPLGEQTGRPTLCGANNGTRATGMTQLPKLPPVLARSSQAAPWDSYRTLFAAGQPALSDVHSTQQKFASRNTLGRFLGLNTLRRAYSYVYALYA